MSLYSHSCPDFLSYLISFTARSGRTARRSASLNAGVAIKGVITSHKYFANPVHELFEGMDIYRYLTRLSRSVFM
jgi:hypothetical protein